MVGWVLEVTLPTGICMRVKLEHFYDADDSS